MRGVTAKKIRRAARSAHNGSPVTDKQLRVKTHAIANGETRAQIVYDTLSYRGIYRAMKKNYHRKCRGLA